MKAHGEWVILTGKSQKKPPKKHKSIPAKKEGEGGRKQCMAHNAYNLYWYK